MVWPETHVASRRTTLARIAVLSDIHANRQAIDAVLRAAREAGAQSWWCVGDVVGYGADPLHTSRLCLHEAERCIAGNHDLAVAGRAPVAQFNASARAAVEWTRHALGQLGRDRLDRLDPMDLEHDVPLFHGSPRDPGWEYVVDISQARSALEDRRVPLTLIGHTHVPAAWRLTVHGAMETHPTAAGTRLNLGEGRWLINPGAVGQPRDGDARAAWALYDSDDATITFHRTPYDVAAAQGAILAAGLPAQLATRLAEGR